ncbi:MAG: TRAP transporter TatT component family protein, partial [Candidatus Bipolaricaulia bacterium]
AMRRYRWVFIIALLGAAAWLAGQAMADGGTPEELIAQANAAFAARFDEGEMREAIADYEAVLPYLDGLAVQSQAFVLDRLSQAYYELTTFSEGSPPEDRGLFAQGKGYGFQSLALNPGFAEWQDRDFKRALSSVADPAALLWTADNWGAIFGYDPWQGMNNVGKVKALYERCLEVDEAYWGASCHNALGALLVTTPDFLGGDLQAGKEHLERAIALAPDYLENHVVYAQYWGFTYDTFGKMNGIRDRALIERELGLVLEAPIGRWPFWNREAKKEAAALLERLKEFSGG